MVGEVSPLPSIDASYAALVKSLPDGLRAGAVGLPHRLGLVSSPDGGWQEFVNLHPNRELPVYAADQGGNAALPPERLLRFVRAHHWCGFWWLMRDRVADGQVAADSDLLELRRALAVRAQQALEEACSDRALAGRVLGAASRRWRRGISRERVVLRAGELRPAAYALFVRDKLRWIAAPSLCLLLDGGEEDDGIGPDARRVRAGAFQRAHDLFLLGLQAIDDVNDAAEDRALHGRDVPGALGCSPGALLRVAPKLLRRAAAVAAGAHFSVLAFWLTSFARAIAPLHRHGDQLADELDAIAIAGEMEQATEDGL